jgi:hypothetical protein
MSRNINSPALKFYRLARIGLATVALLLVVSPGFAAGTPPLSSPAPQSPNATCPPGGQCFADVPSTNPFYAFINRIYQQDLVTGYPCGGPGEICDPEGRPYYRPNNNVTRSQMAKFIDNARRLPQIHIEAGSSNPLIYTSNVSGTAMYGASTDSIAVIGQSTSQAGVFGESTSHAGVFGESSSYIGVAGQSSSGNGVDGYSYNSYGVYGESTNSQAGHFNGNVQVTGNLSKGGGSFKIDHPLDPANKYLYHSFVESPDMMNVYNGNVTTDDTGEAIVTLPAYFETLNRDFRYQLTIMGDQFAQARVSSKVKDNTFSIKTDKPNVEVSWQVTGIRQDPYANAHRIPVEEDKSSEEKGKYLHPTEWGQPESSGIDYEEQQKMREVTQSTP